MLYLCTRNSVEISVVTFKRLCGNSSVGRAQPCQGWGREFESRFPLWKSDSYESSCLFFVYTLRPDDFVCKRGYKTSFSTIISIAFEESRSG